MKNIKTETEENSEHGVQGMEICAGGAMIDAGGAMTGVSGAVVSLATRWQRRRLQGTRRNVRGRIKKRKPGTRRFVSFRLICTG